jgi:hypothetical protein
MVAHHHRNQQDSNLRGRTHLIAWTEACANLAKNSINDSLFSTGFSKNGGTNTD